MSGPLSRASPVTEGPSSSAPADSAPCGPSPADSGRPGLEGVDVAADTRLAAASIDDVEPAQTPIEEEGDAGAGIAVPVRVLCEFTARRGDLDRRFTPSATAQEGLAGQTAVVALRGPDYVAELRLQACWGPLQVRGRADGFDPHRVRLEEIKTIRGHPDELPANRLELHRAQLRTYGAMLCAQRGLPAVELARIYVDADTRRELAFVEHGDAAELQAEFEARCAAFVDWARQEQAHRRERDQALRSLAFPPGEFRPGQRDLAEAVYRAAVAGRCLLAQAPTGIGKTVGTLFPMLRAMPVAGLDRLAYLTCKGTGRLTALAALRALRERTASRALRVLVLQARDQACEHPDKACHGESCPLARGFYDRLPAARAQAVQSGWLDPPALREVARAHQVCPYYLTQELVRWTDVWVGDVHHAFDPHALLWGLTQAMDWRVGVLVDEAHNLVERTRDMHSGELRRSALQAAAALAPGALRPAFGRALHALERHAPAAGGEGVEAGPAVDVRAAARRPDAGEAAVGWVALDPWPQDLLQPLQALGSALAAHFRRHPLDVGPLLEFHFDLQRLLWLVEIPGDHALSDLQVVSAPPHAAAGVGSTPPRGDDPPAGTTAALPLGDAAGAGPPGSDLVLSLRNVVPARHLRPRLQALHSVVLFSATLAPPEYQRDLLGLPADTVWLDVPPAFPPEHLVVQVADRVSTRWAHRARSLRAVVTLMAAQFDDHPGNYLAFFSSHEYLKQAADALAARRPDIPQWRQDRRMAASAREGFLARFRPGGRGIGFAVLGGVFAEGVDLPGTRLVGAFVATLALPPVTPVQQRLRERLDAMFGPDHGYADRVPAMHKVVQAAGRVLRTPTDRGWLWLLDDRYRQPEVQRLLPSWWGLTR